MSRFLDKRYEALEAYTPGEQPRDQIYINWNEAACYISCKSNLCIIHIRCIMSHEHRFSGKHSAQTFHEAASSVSVH